MPKFLLQGVTNNVRFTFTVNYITRLVLGKTNKISDIK